MEAAVDLNAYCARVGYDGPRTPTLETLRALNARHPASIPFEAIDVLLDRGIDLSPQAVDAKLIPGRRGGYCFEHNSLFRCVLETMGFHVQGLAACTPGGDAETRALNAGEPQLTLADVFNLPVEPAWRPLIERFAEAGIPAEMGGPGETMAE